MDTRSRFGFQKAFFGAAGSPLVEDGRVLANIGGPDAGIVAFDASSGDVLWTVSGEEASYSSPVTATLQGKQRAVFFTRTGLAVREPVNGKLAF